MQGSRVATRGRRLGFSLCGDWLQWRAMPGSGPHDADWIMSGPPSFPRPKSMTDSKQQRLNMVESQVRPSDVTDRRIIQAMLEVPRETFVPAALAVAWPTWTSRCRWRPAMARRLALSAGAAHVCQAGAARRDRSGGGGARCGMRHRLFHGRAGRLAKRVVAVESDKDPGRAGATAAGGIGRRQCRGGRRPPRCRGAGRRTV